MRAPIPVLPPGGQVSTKPIPAKVVRCAIYTRKSSEEGLALEFNSLDAQREGAEAFIASQRAEGWRCLPEKYDDGGFSGGTLASRCHRPTRRRPRAGADRRAAT